MEHNVLYLFNPSSNCLWVISLPVLQKYFCSFITMMDFITGFAYSEKRHVNISQSVGAGIIIPIASILDYYIPVKGNTTLLSSHRGCSKDKIRPTLVLRPSTKLSLLLFRQF